METNFKDKSDAELVKIFNREVGNKGWGKTRAQYLVALSKEMNCRILDFSIVAKKGSLALSKKIKIINDTVVYYEQTE